MNMIGGLAFRDPVRAVERDVLSALLSGHAEARAFQLPGAVLAGVGPSMVSACAADAVLIADADAIELGDPTSMPDPSARGDRIRELHARHGIDFVSHLRGAFAIAVWNPADRQLVLAVDRFGFRRLYYAATEVGIAFGSRANSPLALPGCSTSLDTNAVYAYLNLCTVPAPQSIYQAVRRLAPGQLLVWKDGRVTVSQYWDVSYSECALTREDAARRTYDETEHAIRRTLGGLEPKTVGSFLSGGTDSSTIVGIMSGLTDDRVNAFSIGFQEARYDELEYARLAARRFDAVHHAKVVSADEALACLPDIVAAYDEPFGNNSALPAYLCARSAQEVGMTVLLAGDGGDEIFGGNERYRRESILARYHRIPARLRRSLVEPALRLFPPEASSLPSKARRYVERARLPNPDRFYSTEFFVNQNRQWLLHPDFLEATTKDWPLHVARQHFEAARGAAELNRLLYVDLKITLADNDLFKVVRTAEAAGISVRFPLLDHSLVEFMATLPVSYKVRGVEKRSIFKQAFAGLLPAEILAKVKHGFGLPASDWLKGHKGFRELVRDTLLSTRARQRGYFLPAAVDQLFRLHEEDRTPFYGDILWTLLMLELWHERHGATR